MALNFRVEETGAAKVARAIEQLGEHATHAAPAMTKVMLLITASEDAAWKAQRWKKDADGSKAGVKTGALKRSLTETGDGAIREIHHDHLIYGTSLWYAHFMLGTKRQPKRSILPYGTKTRRAAEQIIAEHLLKGFE